MESYKNTNRCQEQTRHIGYWSVAIKCNGNITKCWKHQRERGGTMHKKERVEVECDSVEKNIGVDSTVEEKITLKVY